jgi:hypothetical protein
MLACISPLSSFAAGSQQSLGIAAILLIKSRPNGIDPFGRLYFDAAVRELGFTT